MTLFELSEGNPGALTFIRLAYENHPVLANYAFFRMQKNNITGSTLYMLWNDCCNRDTKMAVEAALYCSIDFLKNHINERGGYGNKITVEEIEKAKQRK